jgi:hypothetical protein
MKAPMVLDLSENSPAGVRIIGEQHHSKPRKDKEHGTFD